MKSADALYARLGADAAEVERKRAHGVVAWVYALFGFPKCEFCQRFMKFKCAPLITYAANPETFPADSFSIVSLYVAPSIKHSLYGKNYKERSGIAIGNRRLKHRVYLDAPYAYVLGV